MNNIKDKIDFIVFSRITKNLLYLASGAIIGIALINKTKVSALDFLVLFISGIFFGIEGLYYLFILFYNIKKDKKSEGNVQEGEGK